MNQKINYDLSESLKNQIIWNDFRNGSKEALKVIYEENYSSLYYYGIKFVQDIEIVKDIIQELFVELIDSGTRLSSTDNIRFYLLKALRNKLINQLSHQSRFVQADSKSVEFNFFDSVENQLIQAEVEVEIQNQVRSAVKKLSDKQQEIIYLRFYNDLTYSEIATIFKVEMQTVRNLMSRAINALKDDLRDEFGKSLILMFLKISHLQKVWS